MGTGIRNSPHMCWLTLLCREQALPEDFQNYYYFPGLMSQMLKVLGFSEWSLICRWYKTERFMCSLSFISKNKSLRCPTDGEDAQPEQSQQTASLWEKAQEEVGRGPGPHPGRDLGSARHSSLDGGHLCGQDGLLRWHPGVLLLDPICRSLLPKQVGAKAAPCFCLSCLVCLFQS